MRWAQYHSKGYECSSRGDKRFSALFARLADGRTIEEGYQLDVKGYRQHSNEWRAGKGKPPLNGKTKAELWAEYLVLWETWASENPELIVELELKSRDKVLTDMFATTDVNQAHALSVIIRNMRENARTGFTF
jgi:hypothetical protein